MRLDVSVMSRLFDLRICLDSHWGTFPHLQMFLLATYCDMSFVNLRYGLAACCAIGFAAVLDFFAAIFGNFVTSKVPFFLKISNFQVLGMLLLGAALGYNSRSWQARTLTHEALGV